MPDSETVTGGSAPHSEGASESASTSAGAAANASFAPYTDREDGLVAPAPARGPTRPLDRDGAGPSARETAEPAVRAQGLLPPPRALEQQFENALREEEPDANVFKAFLRRPAAVSAALLLFAFLYVVSTFFSASSARDVGQALLASADVQHVHTRLAGVCDEAVSFQTELELTLDYDRVESLWLRALLGFTAPRVGNVALTVGTLEVRAEQRGRWEHLALVHVPGTQRVALAPRSPARVRVDASLTAVGAPALLQNVSALLLGGESVCVRVSGTAHVARFGLSGSAPFTVEQRVRAAAVSDLLASVQVLELAVGAKELGVQRTGVAARALVSLHAGLPLSGELPALNWSARVPGCDAQLVTLCNATSAAFELDETLQLQVNTTLHTLPAALVEPCRGGKSPLDALVSAYLAGSALTLHVASGDNGDGLLARVLRAAAVPLTVPGKSPSEKLVQSVEVQDVMFDTPLNGVATFSGRADVRAKIPALVAVESPVAYITSLRGVIQLFDEYKRHFAQVLADKPIATITLPQAGNDYEVVCYFDKLPVDVTNARVFADVSRQLVVQGSSNIRYDAVVDLQMDTPIGSIELKGVRVRGATVLRK